MDSNSHEPQQDNESERDEVDIAPRRSPYRTDIPESHFPVYYPTPTSVDETWIYCRGLLATGNGFPPRRIVTPCDSARHTERGVGIGDVGYFDERGGFQYKFNIFYPVDHDIQGDSMPENFRSIEPGVDHWKTHKVPDYFKAGTFLCSEAVGKTSTTDSLDNVEFSSSAREGCVLALPQGASREDLDDVDKLVPYIKEHASNWYQFLNEYSEIPVSWPKTNSSLFVVTGSDRAKAWSTAVFPPRGSNTGPPTLFRYEGEDGRGGRFTNIGWVRATSSDRANPEGHPCAIFIRGISVALSKSLWTHGIAPIPRTGLPMYYIPHVPVSGWRADLERILLSRFRRKASEDEERLSETLFHPAIVLLQLLIDADSKADVAIVKDSLWCPLIEGRSLTIDEFVKVVKSILSTHNILTSAGVAQFVLKPVPAVQTTIRQIMDYIDTVRGVKPAVQREKQALSKLRLILSRPPPLPKGILEEPSETSQESVSTN